jgi:hypothetical protein
MLGIGHCVHRHCLMNGCGHLKEDFAAPPFLCPVDLAKVASLTLLATFLLLVLLLALYPLSLV